MKKNTAYRYLFPLLATLSAACNNEEVEQIPYESGLGAIEIIASVDSHGVKTRAYNDYHTEAQEMTDLKTVIVGMRNNAQATADPESYNLYQNIWYPADGSSANKAYWDDISNNTYDVRTEAVKVDIWAAKLAGRTAGSGTGEINISKEGSFTWTITTDQTSGIETNDLLAADYQNLYTARKDPIPLCFHHAMTKITVNVKAGTGFTADEVTTNPSIVLNQFNTSASVDLTKKKRSLEGDETEAGFLTCNTPDNVTMHKMETATSGYEVSFDAIVAPGNQISVGTKIGTITVKNAKNASNTYDLKATKALIAGWKGVDNPESLADNASVTLEYGVNYVINATVTKQEITFTAQVVGWDEKTGVGSAEITFSTTGSQTFSPTGDAFEKAFTPWYKTNATDAVYTQHGSAYTYNSTNTNFASSSPMYWNDATDNRYFRAAMYESANASTAADAAVEDSKTINATSVTYSAGKDLLWGTSGTEPVSPTTTDVKMQFSHALTKITVVLITSSTNEAAKVDLTKVNKIEITNTVTKGSLSLEEGVTTASSEEGDKATISLVKTTDDLWPGTWNPHLVIPQTIPDGSKLIITMDDGATYSLLLNSCEGGTTDENGDKVKVGAWGQGEHITYTIYLEKEQISFRAMIKDWVNKTGSGNATLDWDD